jgi:TRAP-type C4-dicarboxylate transport system substrate-binding protein
MSRLNPNFSNPSVAKAFCALIALCALLLTPGVSSAKKIKIATLAPDGSHWMKEMRAGGKEIAERTDGRVKLKFYPGGVMGNDRSVLRKIRVGQLDGGAFTSGGLAEVYPELKLYGIPFLFASDAEADFVRAKFDPVLMAGLREKGFTGFGLAQGGFAKIFSKEPMDSMAKMRGKKVWAPEGDQLSHAAMEALGLSPVSLPLTDVLTGLQTGLLDVVGSSAIGAVALQWYTKVRYVTTTSLSYLTALLVIKNRTFDKLSEGDRAVVREVMERVYLGLDRKNREDDAAAYKALMDEGIAEVIATGDEVLTWVAQANNSAETMAAQGNFSAELYHEILAYLRTFTSATDAGHGGK